MDETKRDTHTEWDTSDMGAPHKIGGIGIHQTPDGISISQKQNIDKILQKQGLTKAQMVQMPLDPKVKIIPNPEGNNGDCSNSYAQLLGELQFVANSTHLDIAFVVNRLVSYTANPSMQHWTAVKRILRYLSGTRDYGITYRYSPDPVTFKGYTDASYKSHNDGKSITSYIFLAAGGGITWRSGKQSITALSSMEAEYIALWEAGKEASWLRNLHSDLGLTQVNPMRLLSDSTGALQIASNLIFHNKTKHIDPKHHWIREKIQAGRFIADYIPLEEQTADVLTKALPQPAYEIHMRSFSLAPV